MPVGVSCGPGCWVQTPNTMMSMRRHYGPWSPPPVVRPSATTGTEKMTMSEQSRETKTRQDNNLAHMLSKEYFYGIDSGLVYINPLRRASWSSQPKRYQIINVALGTMVHFKISKLPLLFFRWSIVPDFGKRRTPVNACIAEPDSAPGFTIIVGYTEDAVSFLNTTKSLNTSNLPH